jgi:hypothetical protein
MALLKTLEEFIEQMLFDYFLTEKQQEEIINEVFEELNKVDPLHDKFFHVNFPFL